MELAHCFANAGYDVECPCLSGHGTRWQDMIGIQAEDWIRDVQDSVLLLKDRCHSVFLVGFSMGGTLALRLAQLDPSIRGIAVINHALILGHPLARFAFLLQHIVDSSKSVASDIKDSSVVEPAYDRTPIVGVIQLQRLSRMVQSHFREVKQPLLIFKSRKDHILPRRNATLTLRNVGSRDKELVWLENSYHVATMDFDKDLIAARCLDFIQKHL